MRHVDLQCELTIINPQVDNNIAVVEKMVRKFWNAVCTSVKGKVKLILFVSFRLRLSTAKSYRVKLNIFMWNER